MPRASRAIQLQSALKSKRCLVVASGFYERKKLATIKQPYWIGFTDRRSFAFAGLWERWTDRASGEHIETYTIITTEPNGLCAPIHNRMPVILDPAHSERWLSAERRQRIYCSLPSYLEMAAIR
jgi:putative SOS response-associated peptidase YedK